MIMSFVHECIHKDYEYRIRTKNTKHAQGTCYTFGRSVLLLQAAHKIASVHLQSSCSGNANKLLAKKSAFNTTTVDNCFLGPFIHSYALVILLTQMTAPLIGVYS